MIRIAQESLTNIAKHADAARVGVTLSYDGDEVVLDVRDDGVGFDWVDAPDSVPSSFGLRGMRQRVARLAGDLTLESPRPDAAPPCPPGSPPWHAWPHEHSAPDRHDPSWSTTTRSSATAYAACSPVSPASRWSARPQAVLKRSRRVLATDPDVVVMDLRMPGGGASTPSASCAHAAPARPCWC